MRNERYSPDARRAAAEQSRARVDRRLCDAVDRKLETSGTWILRYDRDARSGADVPVFVVSPDATIRARALGLRVDVPEHDRGFMEL